MPSSMENQVTVAANEGSLPPIALHQPAGGTHPRHAHLVGIAGAGMQALAEVLLGRGWQLSGSDLLADAAGYLRDRGVRLYSHHAAENLPAYTALVVASDAVGRDNPELRRAAQLGIPTRSYFQVVGELMSAAEGLAVAGTHGKSTTTAMAAHLLCEAGHDPTVLCGATPLGEHSGGRAGRSELVLAEACEYRANFLNLRPRNAVILGIEPDHFDCYNTQSELENAFARFAATVPAGGLILARHDCPATGRVTAGVPCRVETFGTDQGADWSARNLVSRQGKYSFEICRFGRHACDVSLRVPGRHNVLNALAAAALVWHGGVASERIARSLGRFRGLRRRFETLGTWRGVLLIDDYAHHPTEVTAALQTVRQMAPGRRLWCVFQPHQASRTERLLDELAAALHNADKVLVAEIFRAREEPHHSGEVTAADLAARSRLGGTDVANVHDDDEIVRYLQTHLETGDVLITMGAGDIRKISQRLIDHLHQNRAAG